MTKLQTIKNHVSYGNSKLPKSTLIFNLGSATNCPSKKLGLCKVCKACYAMKAERQYPSVLPYRERQAELWKRTDAVDFAYSIVKINEKKRTKIKHVRFNEAGDFSSQADVDKMSAIARILKKYGIRCYVYTARKDLDFSKRNDNLIVNGSGFMVDNAFVAVKEHSDTSLKCIGDCKKCSLCSIPNGFVIEAKIH